MTSYEYAQFILQVKKEEAVVKTLDEAAVYETAQHISGSFTYLLYEELWLNDFDMDTITEHLKGLYESKSHCGMVYFVFILANAAELEIPVKFTEMSAITEYMPFLSSAIIVDWLEYDESKEITSYHE